MNSDQVNVVVFFGCFGLTLAAIVIARHVPKDYWPVRVVGFSWVFAMAFWLFYWAAGVGGL